MSSGLPHVRSLIRVSKTTRSSKGGPSAVGSAEPESTVHFYVSNLPPQSPERFARLIRGHWGGCESRNHWVRDAQFEEDATRSNNPNLNGNLAVLRSALIALKHSVVPDLSWPDLFERASHKPAIAFNLLCNNSFK